MIIHGLDNLTELPVGDVHLAIGTFDGVHLGHQNLIDAAINAAHNSQGISVVLTFWPHPTTYLRPLDPVPTIMPAGIKNHFLEERGVDVVIQQTFTEDFAKKSAKDFVQLLIMTFPRLKAIYTGEDFHFGYKREGDVEFLKKEGLILGFEVIQQQSILYKGHAISSSRIREALRNGNIEEANQMLGYPYYSTGMIIDKEPKQGDLATLDIVWRPELRPQYGVYAIKAKSRITGKEFKGVANYGVAPTLKDDIDPTLQVYLFEPTEWGPGDFLTVEWLHFIRPELKFESRDALNEQIKKDIEEATTTLRYLF